MPTIKHILFPFDFFKQASLAVPFVHMIASRYGAEISVLSVIPPVWNTPPGGMPHLPGLDAPEHELSNCLEITLSDIRISGDGFRSSILHGIDLCGD